MRKLLALIMILLLLPLPLAVAEESADLAVPTPTLSPEEWGKKKLPHERQPEHIEVVPMDELPPVVEGQHHYLLLCIDQWKSKPRPKDAPISELGKSLAAIRQRYIDNGGTFAESEEDFQRLVRSYRFGIDE